MKRLLSRVIHALASASNMPRRALPMDLCLDGKLHLMTQPRRKDESAATSADPA